MAEGEGAENVVILNLIQENSQQHAGQDQDGSKLQVDEEYAANIVDSSIDEVWMIFLLKSEESCFTQSGLYFFCSG